MGTVSYRNEKGYPLGYWMIHHFPGSSPPHSTSEPAIPIFFFMYSPQPLQAHQELVTLAEHSIFINWQEDLLFPSWSAFLVPSCRVLISQCPACPSLSRVSLECTDLWCSCSHWALYVADHQEDVPLLMLQQPLPRARCWTLRTRRAEFKPWLARLF